MPTISAAVWIVVVSSLLRVSLISQKSRTSKHSFPRWGEIPGFALSLVMRNSVRIVLLDRFNWEQVLHIRPKPEQEGYIPSVLHSLAQAKFENLYPYGIQFEGDMVGFLMYGQFNGVCWINRILVDEHYQGASIGSEALRQLLHYLKTRPGCQEVRTSFDPHNERARQFFTSMGFEPLSTVLDNEWVAVWNGELV